MVESPSKVGQCSGVDKIVARSSSTLSVKVWKIYTDGTEKLADFLVLFTLCSLCLKLASVLDDWVSH
jgi:hypothetical protein